MGISLVIAFIRGWILTLLCLSTFPVLVVAQMFQIQFIAGAGGASKKVYERAGSIATESIAAIRTVASFAAEDKVSRHGGSWEGDSRQRCEQVEMLFLGALKSDGKAVTKTALGAGMGQVRAATGLEQGVPLQRSHHAPSL
mmetsp:Transcript_17091/g.46971  ORF Transcript_17091/g.46971 Transcript_17091/m.46971 type:complete len:141 (-) Transcript_17091:450-872(-)